MMFLVSEVHPFADGNGRVARVLMNAELSAAGEQRIVIPLSYRDDYLRGLRALSRNEDPRPLVRVIDFLQRYAAAIDWRDLRARRGGAAGRPTPSSPPTSPRNPGSDCCSRGAPSDAEPRRSQQWVA